MSEEYSLIGPDRPLGKKFDMPVRLDKLFVCVKNKQLDRTGL